MKLLFYPFPYFDDSFFSKDVILFPKYFDKNHAHLDLFIISYSNNDNIYISRPNYWLFLLKYFLFLIKNRFVYTNFFFFHITLRNCLPIVLTKLICPSCHIVIKSDMSIRNISTFLSLSFINKILFKLMLNNTDKVYIETKWLYNTFIEIEHFQEYKEKIIYETNKIFVDNRESFDLLNSKKRQNSIFIYLRANDSRSAELKAFNRYIQLFLSSSFFLRDKSIHVVYNLNDFYRNIFFAAIKESGLEIITYEGLNRACFLRLLGECEYFFLLSNEESFNFTVVEAMIADCKILTTDVGIVKDLKFEMCIPIFSFNEFSSICENVFFKPNISEEFLSRYLYS
jgi:hypothetical protein